MGGGDGLDGSTAREGSNGSGTGASTSAGTGTGTGADTGAGPDTGACESAHARARTGTGADMGAGARAGAGPGVDGGGVGDSGGGNLGCGGGRIGVRPPLSLRISGGGSDGGIAGGVAGGGGIGGCISCNEDDGINMGEGGDGHGCNVRGGGIDSGEDGGEDGIGCCSIGGDGVDGGSISGGAGGGAGGRGAGDGVGGTSTEASGRGGWRIGASTSFDVVAGTGAPVVVVVCVTPDVLARPAVCTAADVSAGPATWRSQVARPWSSTRAAWSTAGGKVPSTCAIGSPDCQVSPKETLVAKRAAAASACIGVGPASAPTGANGIGSGPAASWT